MQHINDNHETPTNISDLKPLLAQLAQIKNQKAEALKSYNELVDRFTRAESRVTSALTTYTSREQEEQALEATITTLLATVEV